MNFPNYYPPYQGGYYTPNVPDQLAQPQHPMQTRVGNIQNGIIWVSGKQEADAYYVTANSAVALWDANNPVIYLRKADSTGKPSTIVYDLVERTDIPAPLPQPQVDFTQFVTWDKLDEVLSEKLKKPARAPKAKEETDNA